MEFTSQVVNSPLVEFTGATGEEFGCLNIVPTKYHYSPTVILLSRGCRVEQQRKLLDCRNSCSRRRALHWHSFLNGLMLLPTVILH